MLDLVAANPVKPDEVKKITVNISDYFATVLRNHTPQTGLAAKFSLEFAMASGVVAQRVGLRELTDTFVQREDIQKLMQRVEIVTTTEYDDELPGAAPADTVKVELASGRRHRGRAGPPRHRACDATADRGADLRQVRRLPGCRWIGDPGRDAVRPAEVDPVDHRAGADRRVAPAALRRHARHPAIMESSMKVGLFINTQFPEGDSVAARIPELVEQVRVARESGFSSVLFPHHYLTAPLQMLQITPLMAYLLPEARGMTVGGNILLLPLLNPVHVAEEAATLDVLSGGNFVLGVGLGYREGEFGAFNIPLKERAPRFTESIALMRKLWTEDRVTFQGRFYSVQDHGISLKPHRPGGPPVPPAPHAAGAARARRVPASARYPPSVTARSPA
jgi:hypothetical protein